MAHLGAERGHDDPRLQALPDRRHALPHAPQRLRVRAAHAQEEPPRGQPVPAHTVHDVLRPPRVERHHPYPEVDPLRLGAGLGEGPQPVDRPGVVHPERGKAPRLRLARRRADDLGCDAGEDREAPCRLCCHVRLLSWDGPDHTPRRPRPPSHRREHRREHGRARRVRPTIRKTRPDPEEVSDGIR